MSSAEPKSWRHRLGLAGETLFSPFGTIAVFFVLLTLGTLGFEESRAPDSDWIDSCYRALQLFALSWSPVDNVPTEVNGLLRAAQFLAPALTVISILALISKAFVDWFRFHFQLLLPRRAVLLGYGAINRAFSRELDRDGWVVVAIDRSFSEADLAFARRHRVLLIPGDVMNPAVLQRVRPDLARKIFVASGSDAANVEIARMASIEMKKRKRVREGPGTVKERRASQGRADDGDIQVHISAPATMRALNALKDSTYETQSGVHAYSMRVEAARVMVRRARFAERARDLGRQRVHLAIVGLGDLGEAVLAEVLMNVIEPDAPPAFTLIDCDLEAAKKRIVSRYPRLFDETLPEEARPQINWLSSDALSLDCSDWPDTHPMQSVTGWIFCCRDDAVNLGAAAQLENAMNRLDCPPVPIHARLWENPPIAARDRAVSPANLLRSFGDIATSTASRLHRQEEIENLAMRIHGSYQKGRKLVDQFDTDPQAFRDEWESLPETARLSSRAAARHLVQKLEHLGLNWRGRGEGRIPRLPEGLDWAEELTRITDEPKSELSAVLEDVARVEHCRFMVERALSGWRRGDRNNRRMRHNDITAFENLTRETKHLDLQALQVLRWMPPENRPLARPRRRLHMAPGEARRDCEGVTEIVLTLWSDDSSLPFSERTEIEDLLMGAAGKPDASLVRVLVRILGQGTLALDGEGAENTKNPPLKLPGWLSELQERLQEKAGEEILFDVVYLPGETGPDAAIDQTHLLSHG